MLAVPNTQIFIINPNVFLTTDLPGCAATPTESQTTCGGLKSFGGETYAVRLTANATQSYTVHSTTTDLMKSLPGTARQFDLAVSSTLVILMGELGIVLRRARPNYNSNAQGNIPIQ